MKSLETGNKFFCAVIVSWKPELLHVCMYACVESSLLWLSQGGTDQYANVSFLIKPYFHGLLNK